MSAAINTAQTKVGEPAAIRSIVKSFDARLVRRCERTPSRNH